MNLPPFKLERYFAKYEFNTEYLLCSSDCEAMSIADLLVLEEGAAEKFQHTWLGYTESLGHPALRKEIALVFVVHDGKAARHFAAHDLASQKIRHRAQTRQIRG